MPSTKSFSSPKAYRSAKFSRVLALVYSVATIYSGWCSSVTTPHTYGRSRDARARARSHVYARTHAIVTDGHTAVMHTLSIRVFARYVNSLPDVDRRAQGTQLRAARLRCTGEKRIAEEFRLSVVRSHSCTVGIERYRTYCSVER